MVTRRIRIVESTLRYQVREVPDGYVPGSPCTSPDVVSSIVRAVIGESPVEKFLVLILDGKYKLVAVDVVSTGTLNSSLVHPREVFGSALRTGGVAAIIVAHNHPSGDPTPSPEDRTVTRRLRDAGKLLGVPVLDHVIIGDGSYESMRETERVQF